ncbi:MAG: hypothetical protein Q9168_005521 [Polycauliona sp. 1 TL-2023]
MVMELKSFDAVPSKEMLYNIRVLHCLRYHGLFARLVGVVVDNESAVLKSFLLEYRQASHDLQHMSRMQGIPWFRREQWARQLVEALSEIHSNGLVLGIGNIAADTLFECDTQKIQFGRFKPKLELGRPVYRYPPEFHHLQSCPHDTPEDERPDVTSKVDIFRLGACLWIIAENSSQLAMNPACIRAKCGEQDGKCIDPSHFDVLSLPPLPDNIPLYYRTIVDSCRSADPNNRPAARRMLEQFPSPQQPFQQRPQSLADPIPLETSLNGFGYCDACNTHPLPLPFFTCTVCSNGSYDLCQTCFNKGLRCYQPCHWLVEMIEYKGMIVPGRYHQRGDSGEDKILEV